MLRDEGTDEGNGADEALDRFLPAVAGWFRENLGTPTLPQRLGWPEIAAGRNTLIVAPTGSGKTLAAFLAALDLLWRTPRREKGVRILYISPLKALNEDVRRNLGRPLEGILEHAEGLGSPLGRLSVATRSGDTPQAERARIVRKPPDILITTPESLHLMLTSRAREVLRGVSHVIVDEIHAVCGDKRGVFLALLLERLEALANDGRTPPVGAGSVRRPSEPRPARSPDGAGSHGKAPWAGGMIRIGLSATQRPLEEVARYLGGQRIVAGAKGGERRFEPRPVTIVDAGRRKTMDLKVLWPGADGGGPPGPPQTVWPAIADRLIALTEEHKSTIVFANNRRTVEKLTARLNEALEPGLVMEAEEPGGEDAHAAFRPHHGSLSLDERRATEEKLKSGELQAVISTASLELGIDMGDVDLVCQVESPGSVARGLQRVGRAGHVVHGVSKGRLIAKTPSDLLETAALARSMLSGDIEASRVPRACLDVLAQQVVACVAMDRWTVPELFDLVRGAYPFRDLPAEAMEQVLLMISGRFPTGTLRDLRARIVWDRIHNALAPLPGTAKLAIVGGGTIPDTGQFPVYLGEGGPRLGELDEEFVFERRVGETFALGNSLWRIASIDAQRVIVGPAEGRDAVMPFWRGESAPRTGELGEAVGRLTREIAGRIDDPSLPSWLEAECRLEPGAARQLVRYVGRQRRVAGAVPDDRTVLYETFRDQTGELGLAVLSPFGGRVHQGLKIALLARIRERFHVQASCLHGDDGLLIRLPQMDEPPLDLLGGLTPDEAERLIRLELPDTALFGLRFRQNAARALLMPRPDPAKRTPLWLQRLRAKDLLQVVGRFPEFPIVVETYRECLEHDLELPRLRALLAGIEDGSIRVAIRPAEVASPFASDLLFEFTPLYMYQWDEPRRGDRRAGGASVDEDLLDALLEAPAGATLLDPQAVGRVEGRLRRKGKAPRSVEEMAETLASLGDLAPSELVGPMERWLGELEAQGRASRIELEGTAESCLWIPAEEVALYRAAFGADGPDRDALDTVVGRFVRTHALVGLAELTRRYPVPPGMASDLLERWVESGALVRLAPASEDAEPRWADGGNLAEIRRLTVAMRRREGVAVAPEVFADFLVGRQGLDRPRSADPAGDLDAALDRLRGFAAPPAFWEEEILPRRVQGYRPGLLDELLARGDWLWRAAGGPDSVCVAFVPREFAGRWPAASTEELGGDGMRVLDALEAAGASFAVDLARRTGMEPSALRRELDALLRAGLVANDRFDPLRSGGASMVEALEAARSQGVGRRGGRRLRAASPEGRWSRLGQAGADDEGHRRAWIEALLDRYGVVAREMVEMDRWAPPWSELAPQLARAELRGELRRGYFVEGFSGVQYATEEAADELASLAGGRRSGRDVLVAASDPANLYGSGAPLDIPLLEGGTARLSRQPGSYLVLRGGRPVLIVEGHGRRLTGLASASRAEIDDALVHVAGLARSRQVFRVETYNGGPAIQSPIQGRLAELGFVRDFPRMTFYSAWAPPAPAEEGRGAS
ncbi:putative ATP-dependent helicase Lhr [Aquisphaera giovannonii]|uniref:Putative ATP-dependent helicase Lhr n=1 Tax=Aquisphaera giovannonii TaxID=406548 RepID=A0A5B9W117_9BACT|nr:DEAD/DEAH box helicase [Aquisphaera giovannonii]QEH33997.1 putative ATP-dependent helicase Lhr [Aquisphaera giovannonii]